MKSHLLRALPVALLISASAWGQVYDHGDPTDDEQWGLELINRARRNPVAEGTRLGIDITEGLGGDPVPPVPPLAFHPILLGIARAHNADMYVRSFFAHINPDMLDPTDRALAAGYGQSVRENIAVGSSIAIHTVLNRHDALMIDAGVTGRGHRRNMLDIYPGSLIYREIGLGYRTDAVPNALGWRVHETLNFGLGTTGLLVGVVINDGNGDNFYAVGEGVQGVTITPSAGTWTAMTSTSGGYAFPISGSTGFVNVTASGPGLPGTGSITKSFFLKGENAKVDFKAIEAIDSDLDGLPDFWEAQYPTATDPAADADNDTWTNLEEFRFGSNPVDPASDPNNPDANDTDGDGLPDGWEITNFGTLTAQTGAGDADGDGLSNSGEFGAGTNPNAGDTDGDLMGDYYEVLNGLDPLVNDSAVDLEPDGLTNAEELAAGTDPNVADTDLDGMQDGAEVANGLNPLVDDAAGDLDNDGLTNAAELIAGTLANNPDTDGDGMWDGFEVNRGLDPLTDDSAGNPDADGLSNFGEFLAGTDPFNPDTDGDMMQDGPEVINGLDPLVNDAAGDLDTDGLTNAAELAGGTLANNPDTDFDSMPDGYEVNNGLDPLVNDAALDREPDGLSNLGEFLAGTNPNVADTDLDTMNDGYEVANGLDPLVDDRTGDLDGDGVTNFAEFTAGTLPNNPDSDGDGMPDGFEIGIGLNPLDSTDANGDLDGDGYGNGLEYLTGSDPNDPNSIPPEEDDDECGSFGLDLLFPLGLLALLRRLR